METPVPNGLNEIVLGGGCFWCVEAIFLELRGVKSVVSGYSGGKTTNPTYKEICEGNTGHAEVVKITYDPAQIGLKDLLYIFLHTHNPTTLNRQGNDVGTQYRSVIFYHNNTEKELAQQVINELNADKIWPDPIITELTPAVIFYPAEQYHQNYYNNNQSQPYCSFTITPKIKKLREKFADKLK